ncbi:MULTISPECIES: efflux RND transporter permease subunit [Alphaproteobacteria]|uniref:efflux RND transporter permease subunit n=1 Tax=Alphaproteobacteria TaxID=28211 RepID=UPI0009276B50|nr:efflux RND transporter permease subunit [Sphingopyxis sp. GW247-27LB]OJX78199.1 MAG: multidrug efflux RND transporter permease [Magnetospirillum sp. 64-120]PAL25315.1 hydrophobe/amphiphile efflux-1 family RND transporter [Sphingopyxis sp. GW247-27LB]
MISQPFIARPILAWVIAIGIMLAGAGAIFTLPIEQYPDIAPTQVNVRAHYPGASAETLESSVTQIIEQQLTGLPGLLYFSATSSSDGQVTVSAMFNKDIDPDIAQVQVQNKVQQALSRLPQEVQEQGLTVTKSNDDTLLLLAIYDETDRQTDGDVADYLVSNLQDLIARLPGVDSTNVFGSQYAMRIWLDPYRLAAFSLMPSDVIAAIEAQNTQVAAGQIGGQPSPRTQMLNATVTARSRLTTPAEFRNIILKTRTDGSQVLLSDIARVEMGNESYTTISRYNRHPAAGITVQLAPGADALATADSVKALVARQAQSFPSGFRYAFPRDSTVFIRLSVSAVAKTLVEAIVLVVVVMFVFLQSWRATLIPAIAVPVVLLGTFGVLALFGYSINTLTLFGLVLSIGLLVDDAIVVVENVERVMEEDPDISPRDATLASMSEIQSALIGIALVLSAVFLPMAFFGGSIGVIYRQFSITIISSMILSVVVALILTPALTATLLKRPESHAAERRSGRIAHIAARLRTGFNDRFDRTRIRYVAGVEGAIRRPGVTLLGYAGIVGLLMIVFLQLPKGFLPIEDQGQATFEYTLPTGATTARTLEVAEAVERYFLGPENANVEGVFTVTGSRSGGTGQNVGQGFLQLAPWSERAGTAHSATGITERATEELSALRDADVVARTPPPVQGFSQSAGFTMQFQNAAGLDRETFKARRDQLLAAARADPVLASVRLRNLEDTTTLQVEVDQAKVGALGIDQADVDETLTAAWGGVYVNDFVDRGRVKRVYVQSDASYRASPEDLRNWHVRTAGGQMAPFASFATTSWSQAPATLTRFKGLPSFAIQGQPAPGRSSGEAMARMIELAEQVPGTSVDWSGLSYQERLSAGQAPLLYALSILVVFLCLAGLYESWSIPISVLMVIPLGLVGAVLAVALRGLENDVYFQVGVLTTIGLSAKNAILIVEFAEQAEKAGKSIRDAAVHAARLRLRPILMTSVAFIFGSLPLALSTGPGAQSRLAIGTSVIGGMLAATVLAIFFVPLFFVVVRKLFGGGTARNDDAGTVNGAGHLRPD